VTAEIVEEEGIRQHNHRREIGSDEIIERGMLALVNEGARILDEGIAMRASDIDVVYVYGYGYPVHRGGPMFWADQMGLPAVLEKIRAFQQAGYGDATWAPSALIERLVAEPVHLISVGESERRDRVVEALEAVGLGPGDLGKFIHEFAGGQRQRIAIARAIVIRPKLVILDEAVSALDVSIRAQILDLLAALQHQFGLSYLFISHDLSVVRAITDRVLVMQAGRIVEEGETDRVFEAPRDVYTRTLIEATPRIPEDWLAA